MTAQPNEPESQVDFNENERVERTIDRLMSTSPPHIGWMTSELANKLLHAHSGARTLMMMSLLRSGIPQEQAQAQAAMQAPLLLFDLGMRVGKDIAGTQALRDMFGDDLPDFPD